jgi:outer membrane protein TolC
MRKRGVTIVLVTHDPEVVHYTKQTVHIRDGRNAEQVTAVQEGDKGMKLEKIILILLVLSLLIFLPLWVQAQGDHIGLQEVIQRALQNSPQVLSAEEDLAAAELELKLARRSLFIPQLSLTATPLVLYYNTGSATLSGGLSLPTGTTLSLSYSGSLNYENGQFQGSFGVELTQPLFKDLSLTSTALDLQRKQVAWEEARQSLEETKSQVVLDAIEGFFSLLVLQESMEIAQTGVELNRAQLEEVQSKVNLGQAGQLDLLAAQIDLRQSELNLAKLQNNYSLNREKFFNSLVLDKASSLLEPRIDYENLLKMVEAILEEDITSEVILRNREVRQAERDVEEAEQNLRKVRQDAFPNLALRVNYDHSTGWVVSINLSYSLFSSHDLKIMEAERDLEVAHRALESAKEAARLEIYSQRDSLKEAQGQMKLLGMKGELMALQEEMKQKQLDKGLIGKGEWEEFLIQKRGFENDYREAMYNLVTSYLKYTNYLGMDLNLEEVISDEENP